MYGMYVNWNINGIGDVPSWLDGTTLFLCVCVCVVIAWLPS